MAAWIGNRAADLVICFSRIEQEKLVSLGLKASKTAVVWNGVPEPRIPDPAEVAAFRAKWGLSPKRLVIGAVGRLEKQKGLEYLLEAVGLLKSRGLNPPVLLVGDGRERPALEQQARSIDLDVVFTGFLREKDRDAALAASTSTPCHPSVKRFPSPSSKPWAPAKPSSPPPWGNTGDCH